MHEISPVLAGTFDAPDYAPTRANFNQPAVSTADATGATDAPDNATSAASVNSSSSVSDSQRYSKWDHQASQVADASMSFDDFLDMVNPLQHIPVVSSVYRGVTNEDINPVSRIVGDMLYGGVFGVASAAIGGFSAVANSMMVASTGHDGGGYVLASIFGTDDKDGKKDQVQLAQNDASSQTNAAAGVATLAALAPASGAPAQPPVDSTSTIGATPAVATADASSGLPLTQAKMYSLDRSKLPYGGVMAPPSIEAQNTAIALSQASHSMRLGNMIYTSPLMNGPHPLPVASTASSPAAPTPAQASTDASAMAAAQTSNNDYADVASKTGPQQNPIPQNLIDDMMMLHGLKQYQGVAAGPATTGTTVNLTN